MLFHLKNVTYLLLATHYHSHYHFHFVLFKLKDLVAKQHATIHCICVLYSPRAHNMLFAANYCTCILWCVSITYNSLNTLHNWFYITHTYRTYTLAVYYTIHVLKRETHMSVCLARLDTYKTYTTAWLQGMSTLYTEHCSIAKRSIITE